MSEVKNDTQTPQDGQKTIVAFIVGLLIGGLIVWMFSGTPSEAPEETSENNNKEELEDNNGVDVENGFETENIEHTDSNGQVDDSHMEVGDGSVEVNDQPAGDRVTLEAVTFPMSDGWIGVRDYTDRNLGALLGVMRFSESQGLIPQEIILQAPTTAGNDYAIVFYTASDTNQFNLRVNSQIEGVFATFKAE